MHPPPAPLPLQGALLLVLFQTSHALEHLLTHKAQGNLTALYDTIPTSAVLVEVGGGQRALGGAACMLALATSLSSRYSEERCSGREERAAGVFGAPCRQRHGLCFCSGRLQAPACLHPPARQARAKGYWRAPPARRCCRTAPPTWPARGRSRRAKWRWGPSCWSSRGSRWACAQVLAAGLGRGPAAGAVSQLQRQQRQGMRGRRRACCNAAALAAGGRLDCHRLLRS